MSVDDLLQVCAYSAREKWQRKTSVHIASRWFLLYAVAVFHIEHVVSLLPHCHRLLQAD